MVRVGSLDPVSITFVYHRTTAMLTSAIDIVRQQEAPRYMTAVWVSIGSHIMIIGFVVAFSAYFYVANKNQRAGKVLLERTEGFRFTS